LIYIAISAGTTNTAAAADPGVLDLRQFDLVFDENFNTLDVSSGAPHTRWTAHTPWAGDFGDAQFVDPEEGFPFTISNGNLRIEARKGEDGRWRSGLLSSVGPGGQGFALQYGYFEMRAKLPRGPGLWPAFWLDYSSPKDSPDPSFEIDVMEHYGKFPHNYNSTVIIWPKPPQTGNQAQQHINELPDVSFYDDFHIWGVSVDPTWIIMYFDRAETWRLRTPPEHKHKLMILLDLALGSGWPIDQTPSPSYMYVDYVRAYSWRSAAEHQH
jgi:beta-glucanase (GH16 family)